MTRKGPGPLPCRATVGSGRLAGQHREHRHRDKRLAAAGGRADVLDELVGLDAGERALVDGEVRVDREDPPARDGLIGEDQRGRADVRIHLETGGPQLAAQVPAGERVGHPRPEGVGVAPQHLRGPRRDDGRAPVAVEDDCPPAGTQHPGDLAGSGLRVRQVLEDPLAAEHVDLAPAEGQGDRVAVDEPHSRTGLVCPPLRLGAHARVGLDARDGALGAHRRSEPEDLGAGARADVDAGLAGRRAERRHGPVAQPAHRRESLLQVEDLYEPAQLLLSNGLSVLSLEVVWRDGGYRRRILVHGCAPLDRYPPQHPPGSGTGLPLPSGLTGAHRPR